MSVINEKCQVPTPREVVQQMLDQIDYKSDLYGKRILESSCGEGAFLEEILRRYIVDCKIQGKSNTEICLGIQRDIHGFEKDRRLYQNCIKNLEVIANEFGLSNIHWNIKRRNALPRIKRGKYQFVVGNPPYLSYPDQDLSTRTYLRNHFQSCAQGKPDLYYAFIEASLTALAPDGRFAYLFPGNFMKNLYAEDLRQLLRPFLYKILNYSHSPLFYGYMTSSVILLGNYNCQSNLIEYDDLHYKYHIQALKSNMNGKWKFAEQVAVCNDMVEFSELFCARAPVATQLNKAYILNGQSELKEGYLVFDNESIEVEVVRNAAAPSGLQRNQQEKIIFPYSYDAKGNLLHYDETIFEEKFPGATAHLKRFFSELQSRKKDKRALWFEYGRSQLLMHLQQEKLVLSTLITHHPNIYWLDAATVPYAGICVTAKQHDTINQAERVLESAEFMDYVRTIGVCTSSITFRISPRDINSFRFSHRLLEV